MSSGIQQIPPTCSMLHWYEVCELSSTVWYIISDELNKGQVSSQSCGLVFVFTVFTRRDIILSTERKGQLKHDNWQLPSIMDCFYSNGVGILHPQWLQEILRILRPARTSF